MRWCLIRWLLSLNALLHTSQVQGRSPLCLRWCVIRWLTTECFITHTISIRALITMYALMPYQCAACNECLITHITNIRALMSCQLFLFSECRITYFTWIWTITPMYFTGTSAFCTVYMKFFIHSNLVKTQRLNIIIHSDRNNSYFYSKIHSIKIHCIWRDVIFTKMY